MGGAPLLLKPQAGDAILAWAESSPRVTVRYTTTFGIVAVGRAPLLKIRVSPDSIRRALEVHLETLARHGAPWDEERIEQLVHELDRLGVELDSGRRWAYAPIEPLAVAARRELFIDLINLVIDTLNEPTS